MQSKSNAFHAGLGYTIGNILIKGINFLTLPLFSRLMTTEQFGTYNIFLSYDAVLSIILGLAMHTSVKSAHYQFKDTDRYVSSIALFYILSSLLFFLFVLGMGNYLESLLGFDRNLLLLLIPFSFGGGIIQLYNQRISLDYNYKNYLVVALCNSLGNVIVSILLIFTVYQNQQDIGRILGTVVTIFTISIMLVYNMFRKAYPHFYKKFWRFGIIYSLPIVPHGLSQVLLGQCDRIMISKMIGYSEAGIYSLAGNLQLILAVITNSVGVSWSTYFFSKMEKNEIKDIQHNAVLLMKFFLVFTIGLMAISPEVIYLMGGSAYKEGQYVAIPMVASGFFIFVYSIIIPSEYYMQKTVYIMIGTMLAAIINIITNYMFIRIVGYVAAAYTTLFSYFCYLSLHFFISRRLVHFDVVSKIHILVACVILLLLIWIDISFVNNMMIRYIVSAMVIISILPPLIRYMMTVINKQRS